MDHLNLNSAEPQTLNSICQQHQHQHLQDVKFPILPNNAVTVLLGQDNCDLITPELVIKGDNNSPRAIPTELRWTIAGPNQSASSYFTFRVTTVNAPITSDNELYELLASSWKTETYNTSPETTMSKEERHALSTLQKEQLSVMADTKSVSSGSPMLRYRITSPLQSNNSRKRYIASRNNPTYTPCSKTPLTKTLKRDTFANWNLVNSYNLMDPSRTWCLWSCQIKTPPSV